MGLKENLEIVRRNIGDAAVRSGRRPEDVRLVAVTKTVGVDSINDLFGYGAKDIGESKVQDVMMKYPKVKGDLSWHMVGHLQTNKVKDAVRIFDLVYVLTNGGPGGSTMSLSLYGYKYFLGGDFGYGSAVSVILFIIAFALSLIYVKLGRFREAVS